MSRALLLAGLLAVAGAARAGDHVLLAGTEWSRLGSYTYAGAISPLGGGRLGDGFVVRHWIEALGYEYDAGATEVQARRAGYAPALGYQWQPLGGYAGAYAGVRLADTDLDPEDPGNRDEGATARVFLQADAVTPLATGVENQFVGELETRYSGYYLRDRVMFRLGRGLSLGPEGVLKGGEDYDGWQAGLALGGVPTPVPGLGLTLRAGWSGQRDEPTCGYVGVEFVITM